VRKRFRVPKTFGLMPGRVTFVIDSEGTIRYIFSSQFKATEHISRTLDIIKNI
jgi:peroxiredoxin Q/BCP